MLQQILCIWGGLWRGGGGGAEQSSDRPSWPATLLGFSFRRLASLHLHRAQANVSYLEVDLRPAEQLTTLQSLPDVTFQETRGSWCEACCMLDYAHHYVELATAFRPLAC